MAYTSIFVASLLVYSALGFANPVQEACVQALFSEEPETSPSPADLLVRQLRSAQFERIGHSTLFHHFQQTPRFVARVIPCARKGADVEFFVDFLAQDSSAKIHSLEQIRALVPNGAAGGTSLASQKPHLLFIFAPDERGLRRHLVLSADGTTANETPYLPFNRIAAIRIAFQEHCSPVGRLSSVGFKPVPEAEGFYQFNLKNNKASSAERPTTILAQVENGKLVRLMRPLKFTVGMDPNTILRLSRVEIKNRWAYVELTGHVFTRDLRFNATGSESVTLRLNPEFDLATSSSSRRFAEFLGLEEFLKERKDPGSGFTLGGTNPTEFLKGLKPHSTINDVAVTEAESMARDAGLLAKDQFLVERMVEANRKIVDERKIAHSEVGFPVMVAVSLAHNDWGRIFCYKGKQFKVDVAEADHPMWVPFHPELGSFSKIVTVTDLSSKESHSFPEVLALTILDGFYGQLDPDRLADFFLKVH